MSRSALDARTMEAGCELARGALDACVDHDEAVAAALESLRMHVGPELLVASVVLLEHDRLWILAQRGYEQVFDGQRLDEGVMARAVKTGEVQFLPDVTRPRRDGLVRRARRRRRKARDARAERRATPQGEAAAGRPGLRATRPARLAPSALADRGEVSPCSRTDETWPSLFRSMKATRPERHPPAVERRRPGYA